MQFSFADVLGRFLDRAQSSASRVAKLSGVPKQTISHWQLGHVREPYHWQPILKVARVLHLSEAEVNQLLNSAGHPALVELRAKAKAEVEHLLPTTVSPLLTSSEPPFQVIPDLPMFVGRQFEIEAVKTLLLNGKSVAICSFRGMGGVGKTSLAAHLAYQLRAHFSDGVLWARVDAADTMSTLGSFASALGHDVSHLCDLESRSATVRGILASKRVLLILDNATSSEQVRHLLPPTPGSSAAIITTRNDLLISDTTHRFEITPFDPERGESLALFEHFLGKAFIVKHLDLLVKMAERLGHLPLAVSIAAGKIQHHFHQDIEAFWDELQRADDALGSLEREDRSVRLSFDLGYNQLPLELQNFFDTLGVFGGEDFSMEAVAYVNDVDLVYSQKRLRLLSGYSLVEQSQKRRYRLHPLLREYACEHLTLYKPLYKKKYFERMRSYFAHFAENFRLDYEKLDMEFGNLLYAHEIGVKSDSLKATMRQSVALFPFFELRGLYAIAEQQMKIAKEFSEFNNDRHSLAISLFHLGIIAMRRSEYSFAIDLYEKALTIAHEIGDLLLSGRIEKCMAATYLSIPDHVKGERHAQRAWDVAQVVGDHEFLAEAHIIMGSVVGNYGDWSQAEQHYQEAAYLAREENTPRWLLIALMNLSEIFNRRGELSNAEACISEGLSVARSMSYHERISGLLANLASVMQTKKEFDQAEQLLREAIAIATKIGHRWLLSGNYLELGWVKLAQSQLDAANIAFETAFELAEEINVIHYAGLSQWGLAKVAKQRQNYRDALAIGNESLRILNSINHHNASAVMKWLSELSAIPSIPPLPSFLQSNDRPPP